MPAGPRLHGRRRAVLTLAVIAVLIVPFFYLLPYGGRLRQYVARRFSSVTLSRHPNVVLITIDTLRADHLGSYGDRDAATPVLDALASRGVRFVHAVAHAPLTLPSHASLLTGLTPLAHGVRDNAGFVLGPSHATLAAQFRAAGYDTAAFVSGFPLHRRFGLARGFDVYDDQFPRGDDASRPPYSERRANRTVGAVLGWFSARQARHDLRPFFAWIHFFDPHAPYDPPEPFRRRFAERGYDGEIAFVDAQVGRLVDAGMIGRDAIVVVTADHGEGLGEHGELTHGLFIYESTIRVPLFFAGPGIGARTDSRSLARGVDVAPTLLDLAGVAPMGAIDGRSLRPQIEGRAATSQPAYVESLYGQLNFGWAPLHGWRDRSLMYIDAPAPELYDLATDPGEQQNLVPRRQTDVDRLARSVRAALSSSPAVTRARIAPEIASRLRSLGYIAATAQPPQSGRDPKDMVSTAVHIETAVTRERSDPASAIAEFQAALGSEPSNRMAAQHLAVALAAANRVDEALVELRQLIARGDDSEETLVLLGDTLRLAGKNDQAIAVLGQAAERDPGFGDVPIAIGKCLVSMGRLDEAQAAFQRALAVWPDDPRALSGLADIALARGDLRDARDRLAAWRARDPDDVTAMMKLGIACVRAGENDAAIDLFADVVERRPNDPEALMSLAGALAKAGRPREAVGYFERAVASGARTPVVLNGLGFARLESGDVPGAASAFTQSLQVNAAQPRIVAMLRQLGRAEK